MVRIQKGGTSVVTGMNTINPEQVISKNPDIIVITGQNWTSTPDSMHLGFYASKSDSIKLLQAYTTRSGWRDSLCKTY
ncbi:hypothetical protein [Clostridium kluyveri]|uniref:Fe/B12 periplasmic-binding domain-containing protein n=1 Tax=Clostridium kluyveri TaxID=1534 RepID=A0A1L5F9Y9_CLOKL|nr:hypothetical protein [Clostridium kluyveri]APM39787.1 hypothetical protein BS101_14110 [Clostridium kluyveri]